MVKPVNRTVLLVAALLTTAGPASAATRHASPTGTGTACSQPAPCSIVTAVNFAVGGDEVIVAPGDYGTDANPLTDTITSSEPNVNVHGVVGQPRPRITSSASYALTIQGTDARVSHLAIKGVKSDGGQITFGLTGAPTSGTIADDIEAWSTTGSTACLIAGTNKTFRNTVCRDTSASGFALWALTGLVGDTVNGELRNVTLWSDQGIAVAASGSSGNPARNAALTLYNSIARSGGSTAVYVDEPSGSTASIRAFNSNYGPVSATATAEGPNSTFNPTTATAPLFVDAAAGNFAQQPGSVTIDAGVAQDANGPFAFGGLVPRSVGGAPDIGADEKTSRPTSTKPVVGTVAQTTAALTAAVNPNGLASTYRLDFGPSGTFGASSTTGNLPVGATAVPITIDLSGLAAGTTYSARLVATNASGTSTSAPVTFTTSAAPGPPGGGTTTTPPTPPPIVTPPPVVDPPQPALLARLSRVTLAPARVRAGRTSALSFTLDRAGSVRVELLRKVRGRTRLVRSQTRAYREGRTKVTLSRTFLGRRKGRYTIRVTPRLGTRSGTAVTKTLTIR